MVSILVICMSSLWTFLHFLNVAWKHYLPWWLNFGGILCILLPRQVTPWTCPSPDPDLQGYIQGSDSLRFSLLKSWLREPSFFGSISVSKKIRSSNNKLYRTRFRRARTQKDSSMPASLPAAVFLWNSSRNVLRNIFVQPKDTSI